MKCLYSLPWNRNISYSLTSFTPSLLALIWSVQMHFTHTRTCDDAGAVRASGDLARVSIALVPRGTSHDRAAREASHASVAIVDIALTHTHISSIHTAIDICINFIHTVIHSCINSIHIAIQWWRQLWCAAFVSAWAHTWGAETHVLCAASRLPLSISTASEVSIDFLVPNIC